MKTINIAFDDNEYKILLKASKKLKVSLKKTILVGSKLINNII